MRHKGGKKGIKKGFTLVELSLAVGFIGLLSLTVTLIINDTVATYRRGLTLNNINTTGMDLVDDIRSVIQNSPPRNVTFECSAVFKGHYEEKCNDDNARSLISIQRYANVDPRDGRTNNIRVPVYGAICTGSHSYIWNSGYFFGDNEGKVQDGVEPAYFVYDETDGASKSQIGKSDSGDYSHQNFRLLKVKDERRAVCKQAFKRDDSNYNNYQTPSEIENTLSNKFDISNPIGSVSNPIRYYDNGIRSEDIEIILKDETVNPLALYDLTITPPAANQANEAAFYASSFILGTLQGGINVKASGNFCKPPEDYTSAFTPSGAEINDGSDFDYCSINKFNFAAQATGG